MDNQHIHDCLSRSIKQKTKLRYAAEWQLWMTFLTTRGIDNNPFLEDVCDNDLRRLVVLFIWHLSHSLACSSSKVKHVLGAVSYEFKANAVCNAIFSDSTVKVATSGLAKDEAILGSSKPKRKRLPVTFDMILYLRNLLWDGFEGLVTTLEEKMAFVGILLAFHFCMRVSEYCYETDFDDDLQEDLAHALKAGDVEFHVAGFNAGLKPWELVAFKIDFSLVEHVRLIIRSSKADPLRKGRNLFLSKRGVHESDMIRILFDWCFISSIKAGDVFLSRWQIGRRKRMASNLKLRRKEVNFYLKKMAVHFGFETCYFSTHCIRIGGASTMVAAGQSRDKVKRIGGGLNLRKSICCMN